MLFVNISFINSPFYIKESDVIMKIKTERFCLIFVRNS